MQWLRPHRDTLARLNNEDHRHEGRTTLSKFLPVCSLLRPLCLRSPRHILTYNQICTSDRRGSFLDILSPEVCACVVVVCLCVCVPWSVSLVHIVLSCFQLRFHHHYCHLFLVASIPLLPKMYSVQSDRRCNPLTAVSLKVSLTSACPSLLIVTNI